MKLFTASALLLPLVGVAAFAQKTADKTYEQIQAEWRKQLADDLARPEGWLAVAGLYWLKPGDSTIGSGKDCAVRLTDGPALYGTLTLQDGKVSFKAADGVDAVDNGQPFAGGILQSDNDAKPDRFKAGRDTWGVIVRGTRIGIRFYDPEHKARKEFKGLNWYPVSKKFVIKAKFIPYNPPKKISIMNVLGDTRPSESPGYVEFTVGKTLCRLNAEPEDGGLFFNFRDETTGETTYPAGRFMDAPKPVDGYVTLDFNQATNPPCAFTEFATCPLPPEGNQLKVAIKAGEKMYHPIED